MNHWNQDSDLNQGLAAIGSLVPMKSSTRLIKRVAAAEKSLGFSLPLDLREFYESFQPKVANSHLGKLDVIRISSVEKVHIWDRELLKDYGDDYLIWSKSQYLVFGSTSFFDKLLYKLDDEGPISRGAIIVTAHQEEFPLVVLAENLADWLARISAFEGVEMAVVPGELEDIASEDALEFAKDHVRLNADSEWAARIVDAAQPPADNFLRYWDKREKRLRPIVEMTWLTDVTLSDLEQIDLTPLTALQDLDHLRLLNCNITDLSPLTNSRKLTNLSVCQAPTISVAPLANLTKLKQLRTLQTMLVDVVALVSIPTLEVLEINDCEFNDVAAISSISSLTQLLLAKTQIETIEPLVRLQGLTYLQIQGTLVTDLAPAEQLPNLTSLIVSKDKFSKKTLDAIRKRCPKLKISEW